GTTLFAVGVLAGWKYGFTAGVSCVLAVPGMAAQFRVPPPPRWGQEQLYFGISLFLGLMPEGPADLPIGVLGCGLLWFQVYYCGYLTIAER
ncbi:MAG TPA: hypothetical protein VFS92_04945, partial [Planctomycetota bacterium]|nr:hypothetical protein [Planctomycetota bacterium]